MSLRLTGVVGLLALPAVVLTMQRSLPQLSVAIRIGAFDSR